MTVYGVFDQWEFDIQLFANEKDAIKQFKKACDHRQYSDKFYKQLLKDYDGKYVGHYDEYWGVLILTKVKVEE